MRRGAVLEARGVSVEIDGATLLSPTSIGLAPGECVAVRGPNGAGKTTLLRVLAGRLRPSSGSAALAVAGDDVPIDERRPEVRRHVAALIGPPTLYPDLTLRDQLALIEAAWVGASAGGRIPVWNGLGVEALAAFGIEGLAGRFPHELSSGQRQLVSLAVTFARPCSVLLLDEPEQRLDPDRRALVGRAIRATRERGVAIAFASHDEELVGRVAGAQIAVGAE
ncbi:ABC transporter ATP-binding protein [Leucobacter sp. wl10]|uniref:ABC transporter ATP-binding protein n=1 Tax=Leucobacter sp. wl10 TaxID=2304677 RepID=UPI0013C302D9|nr:ABC transporter ATP-binding protein [Leucobacter sp. wl10]